MARHFMLLSNLAFSIFAFFALNNSAYSKEEKKYETLICNPAFARKVPDRWRGVGPLKASRLVSMSLFSGPPEQLASLAPDNDSATRPQWKMDPATSYWVTCNYEHAIIAIPVPAGATTCAFEYKARPARKFLDGASGLCR